MRFIPFSFPGIPNIGCAFSARTPAPHSSEMQGGNISFDVKDNESDVSKARHDLQQQLGFKHWQELLQVHGPQMIFDPEPGDIDSPGTIEADGQATDRPGQALVIKTADCQPILLAHTSGKYIAALHAGWRGNVLRFPSTAVRDFCREYDLQPADIMAVRGPSLGPGRSEFSNFDSEFGPEFEPWLMDKTQTVDLWRMTRDQLLDAGLPSGNIFGLDLCTMSLPDWFFSYRRNNVCGRQASLIWIK